MNVGNSIRKAIDDWQLSDAESAMLHACNAIDGTARKVYPALGNKARFTRLLRESYGILGPMGMPGINLIETRFPVKVPTPTAPNGQPDLADVIYAIHRCTHGHGDELPDGFALLQDAAGPHRVTHVIVEDGRLRLSDRMIFALVGVAVFSPFNVGQSVPEGYHLTFVDKKLIINDWWGKADDFLTLVAMEPVPNIKLDFSNWTKHLDKNKTD